MTGLAVETRALTVGFGQRTALDEVTVSIPSGVTVAVLGPNGAGKSTLFAAVVGLVALRSGSIRLGSDRVAFVPQRLDVEPAFPVTVGDVVAMGRYGDLGPFRRFGRDDHERVANAIAALGVEGLEHRRFGTLSGGERQRALLAQAAAQDADLLLLDEPFTGVDAPTRDRVKSLVGDWRTEGRTVLVATHDLASAARDYDLVMCLNRRLVAFGPAAQTSTEDVLAETFAGHVIRVGGLVVDVAHHHHGAS
jgi:manganese/zinc/iron transport system ATP- binding protein